MATATTVKRTGPAQELDDPVGDAPSFSVIIMLCHNRTPRNLTCCGSNILHIDQAITDCITFMKTRKKRLADAFILTGMLINVVVIVLILWVFVF